MNDPLGDLFEQFLEERVYLKAFTPKTKVWYRTAWTALKASQMATGESQTVEPANLTRAHLQAFVIHLRDRGIKPRSVNTYLQALNAFARWLKEEGHQGNVAHLPLLRTEKRILQTLTAKQLEALISYHPRTLPAHRVHALVLTVLDTGIRVNEALNVGCRRVLAPGPLRPVAAGADHGD